MKTIILFLIALTFIGCSTTSINPVSPKLNEEFELKYGQTSNVGSGELYITFESVSEDSRCPVDVVCVWAENAKTNLLVNGEKFTLNTWLSPKEVKCSGYTIKLVNVLPDRKVNEVIKPENYRVKLIVEN